jgi:hypothetical protein
MTGFNHVLSRPFYKFFHHNLASGTIQRSAFAGPINETPPTSFLPNLAIQTMPDPPAPSNMGTPFAPCALVQVRVGPYTISLHSVVNQSMLPHKQAHAFHYNKTALAAQNLDLWLQLDALGTQLNLIVTVDGTINNWFCFFYDSWFDFSKLTI